jgi:hypothetical protein
MTPGVGSITHTDLQGALHAETWPVGVLCQPVASPCQQVKLAAIATAIEASPALTALLVAACPAKVGAARNQNEEGNLQ